MNLRVPDYYKEFKCTASKCSDSCCIGWEIDIDQDTFEYYKSISGVFGQRLKENIECGEDNTFTLNENGRCPFLNEKNLCDICIELGEEALSEVCTEYPRFTIEVDDGIEKCLSLSCEEAARIILSRKDNFKCENIELPEGFSNEYEESEDLNDDEFLKFAKRMRSARDEAIEILENKEKNLEERIIEFLIHGEKVNGSDRDVYHKDYYEKCSKETNALSFLKERLNVYGQLEILPGKWEKTLETITHKLCNEEYFDNIKRMQKFIEEDKANYKGDIENCFEKILVYFAFRYIMKSAYDCNFKGYCIFTVVSYIVIRDISLLTFLEKGKLTLEDIIEVSGIYSKEVEHSEENVEMLIEEFMFNENFHIENIIKQI